MSTHRGQDRRFQDNEWHFGSLCIVGEPFHLHHVKLVLGLGAQTHLEQNQSFQKGYMGSANPVQKRTFGTCSEVVSQCLHEVKAAAVKSFKAWTLKALTS